MARPKKYNELEMVQIIDNYTDSFIDNEEPIVPILKDLCVKHYWNYNYVTELQSKNEELSLSIKRLVMLKAVRLEQLALNGVIDKTMAIFSLKQLGWRDKPKEDDNTADKVNQLLDGLQKIMGNNES